MSSEFSNGRNLPKPESPTLTLLPRFEANVLAAVEDLQVEDYLSDPNTIQPAQAEDPTYDSVFTLMAQYQYKKPLNSADVNKTLTVLTDQGYLSTNEHHARYRLTPKGESALMFAERVYGSRVVPDSD